MSNPQTTPSPSTTTSLQSETTTAGADPGGFPIWAIVCIILGIIVLICLSLLLAYFVVRRIRDRRRNHGEYRPQLEETIHAKNLPYISPPNIEGLI